MADGGPDAVISDPHGVPLRLRTRVLLGALSLLVVIPVERAYANDDREFSLAVITTLLVWGALIAPGHLGLRLLAALAVGLAGLAIDFL